MNQLMQDIRIGLAIGLPEALLCGRFVQSQLYNVAVRYVEVLYLAITALAALAFAAGLIPVRRTASTDPSKQCGRNRRWA